MSTEPERDIEKTLRDYARHRADTGGTPPALHPATRKLLQDEVARQNSGARRTTGLGLFWASWPGFILKGSVALAVLVVGAFILTPLWRGQPRAKQAMTLAKNEEVSNQRTGTDKKEMVRAQTSARDEFKPATPTPGGVALRKMDQSNVAVTESLKDVTIASNPATARTRANPTVMPPVTTAPTVAMKSVPTPPATASATTAATAAPALAASRTAMPTATPPVAATVLAPVTASDSIATLADRTAAETSGFVNLGPISQQFTRVNPPARGGRGGGGGGARGGAAALRATVLQSFRVEQNGGQIRVIDSDGSIYTGVVTLGGNLASQSAVNGPIATFAAAAQPTAATNAPVLASAGARSIAPPQSLTGQVADGSQTRSNAPRSDAQVAASYYFRVSGTNLTLKQPVEFSGNFVTNDQTGPGQLALRASAAAGGRRAAGAGGGGGAGGGIGGGGVAVNADNGSLTQTNISNETSAMPGQATGGALAPVPLFNFRLQGQAVIGTNRLGIIALPTRP